MLADLEMSELACDPPPPGPTTRSLKIDQAAPELTDVTETMRWSLYDRATEASRPDGILSDPTSVWIKNSLDYDFERNFGVPEGSLAVRAAQIDHVLRGWLARHPNGIIVSLGEGLETQVQRVDNGSMHWLTVDLPSAIRLRERFLALTARFRHLSVSASDPSWMDAVDPSRNVFVVAQGLLMYLQPIEVRKIISGLAQRFPAAEIVFDVVPCWFSRLTLFGLQQTAHYRLPAMPWGIGRHDIEPILRCWHPNIADLAFLPYAAPRGLPALMAQMIQFMPMMRHEMPSLVHVTTF